MSRAAGSIILIAALFSIIDFQTKEMKASETYIETMVPITARKPGPLLGSF
jgi:hypothetical protein